MTPQRLSQLIDRHAAPLELYAAQWTDAPADVVQEAFVELIRQPAEPQQPAAWLYRVVRNRAISAGRSDQRRRRREAEAAGRCEPWFAPTDEAALDADAATAALRELPLEQREVIVAHLWGGLSFSQIAELNGTSPSTAHRRYEAGLATLRERLKVTWTSTPPTTTNSAGSHQP